MAGETKNNLFSFFGGKKRIPKDSYDAYLKVAIIVDFVLCWLPLAGTVFICYCRGMWWLNGYKTDKMLATTLVNAALEAVPGLSFSPSCTLFIWFSYRINKAGTDPLEGEEGAESKAERAQDVAFRALRRKNARGQNNNETEQPEGQGNEQGGSGKMSGKEERSERSAGEKEPRSQSPLKDAPNQNTPKEDKPVDGIAPAPRNSLEKKPEYKPRQPVFKQQPANDNAPAASESPELPNQDENEEEYFDNAKRVA